MLNSSGKMLPAQTLMSACRMKMGTSWSLPSQKKATLSTEATAMAAMNVRRFPMRLLTGAARMTPRILAACPTARYSPLSTKGSPRKLMLPTAVSST